MKKVMLALCSVLALTAFADSNKVKFTAANLPRKDVASMLDKDVLTIKGDTKFKYNAWYSVVAPMGAYTPGKKIELEAEIKTQITKGQFWVVIRSVDAANKTVDYTGFQLNKSQDWKKMKKTFQPKPATKTLQMYCVGVGLDDNSFGQVKDIEWEYKD